MIGVLLAGGAGRRLGGGSKAALALAGRPLVSYPAAALAAVCDRVAVVCKADTELPGLPGVERWDEPAEPRHPRTGIAYALERAAQPVLVCAADMPFVTTDALRSLAAGAHGGGEPPVAVVAVAGGVLQPTLGLYAPAALGPLLDGPEDERLTDAVERLELARVALPPALVRSVNSPEDLARAESELSGAAG